MAAETITASTFLVFLSSLHINRHYFCRLEKLVFFWQDVISVVYFWNNAKTVRQDVGLLKALSVTDSTGLQESFPLPRPPPPFPWGGEEGVTSHYHLENGDCNTLQPNSVKLLKSKSSLHVMCFSAVFKFQQQRQSHVLSWGLSQFGFNLETLACV